MKNLVTGANGYISVGAVNQLIKDGHMVDGNDFQFDRINERIFQWIRGYYIVGNAENGASVFPQLVQAVKDGEEKFPFTSGMNQYEIRLWCLPRTVI